MYPSYGCEVSPFFSINVLIWWFSGRCSGSFKFIILHSRILFRWIQLKLSVLIIALSSFQMLSHAGISLNHSPLAIQLFRSAEDISEDSCFHSASILTISRLLPHSSHLIQPVQSLFKIISNGVFFWVGPNPQVFSQDLTWLFELSGAILKFISKFDVRMNFHQSHAFSKVVFKFFSSLAQPFLF